LLKVCGIGCFVNAWERMYNDDFDLVYSDNIFGLSDYMIHYNINELESKPRGISLGFTRTDTYTEFYISYFGSKYVALFDYNLKNHGIFVFVNGKYLGKLLDVSVFDDMFKLQYVIHKDNILYLCIYINDTDLGSEYDSYLRLNISKDNISFRNEGFEGVSGCTTFLGNGISYVKPLREDTDLKVQAMKYRMSGVYTGVR